MRLNNRIIIAIDGYSSCGKSTFAKAIAKILRYKYIDSGAMYRAFTLLSIRNKAMNKENYNQGIIDKLLNDIQLDFTFNEVNKTFETYINGENVETEIRNNADVADQVSYISKIPAVRTKMVAIQRLLGKDKGIVMDGRDIGTVVFPDADLKIFMIASMNIRAERRYKELIEKGLDVKFEEVKENIKKRDFIDETRDISPLKKAGDAVILDNSYMTPEDQIKWFKTLITGKYI